MYPLHFSLHRDWDATERILREVLEELPGSYTAHYLLAYYLQAMGRFEEAVGELQKAALTAGEDPAEVSTLPIRLAEEGMSGVWSQWLEWQMAEEVLRPGPVAIGFARLGNAEEAVAWLNRGVDVYESWLFQLNDPLWDPIRESVGFQDLLERLGLPQGRR